MRLKEIIAPSYLSRAEQFARGFAAVGLSVLAIAGGIGVDNLVNGMRADDKADSARTDGSKATAYRAPANYYDDAEEDFIIGVSGAVVALVGAGVQVRISNRRFEALESATEQRISEQEQLSN